MCISSNAVAVVTHTFSCHEATRRTSIIVSGTFGSTRDRSDIVAVNGSDVRRAALVTSHSHPALAKKQ